MIKRYNAPRGTTLSESAEGELVMAADHAAAISVLQYRLEAADEWAAGATATLEKRDAEIAQLRNRVAPGELTGVRCQCCQAEHSSDSYDAGFIAGSGMCQVCDAAIPAKDIHTPGGRDVLAERQRQITAEGWAPDHDDEHDGGELAAAGAAYALHAADYLNPHSQGDGGDEAPTCWPWHDAVAGRGEGPERTKPAWWKPGSPRRDLIKAGALILAEIERLDRAEQAKQQELQP